MADELKKGDKVKITTAYWYGVKGVIVEIDVGGCDNIYGVTASRYWVGMMSFHQTELPSHPFFL